MDRQMYEFSLVELSQIIRHYLRTYKFNLYQKYDYDLFPISQDLPGWYAFVPEFASSDHKFFEPYEKFIKRVELTRVGQCNEWDISTFDPVVAGVTLDMLLTPVLNLKRSDFLGMRYHYHLLYGEHKGQPFLMNLFTESTCRKEFNGKYKFPGGKRSIPRVALMKVMPIGSSEYLDIMYTVLKIQLSLAKVEKDGTAVINHYTDRVTNLKYMVNHGILHGLAAKTAVTTVCELPSVVIKQMKTKPEDVSPEGLLEEAGAISLDDLRRSFIKLKSEDQEELLGLVEVVFQPMSNHHWLWWLSNKYAELIGRTHVHWTQPASNELLDFTFGAADSNADGGVFEA